MGDWIELGEVGGNFAGITIPEIPPTRHDPYFRAIERIGTNATTIVSQDSSADYHFNSPHFAGLRVELATNVL